MKASSLKSRVTARPHVVIVLLTVALFSPVKADDQRLFDSNQDLKLEIQAPWRKLLRTKDDTRWPATFNVTRSDGEIQSMTGTVERRGISRQRVCKFPPIRLRFDKTSVEGTLFEDTGALKMVTHCSSGGRWKDYYVLEMLAYRFYNLVTDYSFRVRPLAVYYQDVDRDKEPEEEFAFVIEDIDKLADRFGLDELELESTVPSQLDAEVSSLLAVFQFMIANLDWSTIRGPEGCCHNAKLIGSDPEQPPFIPIPYDFDSSGIVDAHYAVAPSNLGVRSVTDRYFRGYCRHNRTLPAARQAFLDHRDETLNLVRQEARLSERTRRSTLDFLEEFYETLVDDDEWINDIVERCRG